jgi:hypothetical protein
LTAVVAESLTKLAAPTSGRALVLGRPYAWDFVLNGPVFGLARRSVGRFMPTTAAKALMGPRPIICSRPPPAAPSFSGGRSRWR